MTSTSPRAEPVWWTRFTRALAVWAVVGPILGGAGAWWMAKARADAFQELERKATIERVVVLEGEVKHMKDKTLAELKQQLDVLSVTVQAELQRRGRRQ